MRIKHNAIMSAAVLPCITNQYPLIDRLCAEYGIEFVITEGVGGKHKQTSKHYLGKAIDIRSREFEGGSMGEVCRSFVERLQAELGNDYFVLQEKDHIHMQFNL